MAAAIYGVDKDRVMKLSRSVGLAVPPNLRITDPETDDRVSRLRTQLDQAETPSQAKRDSASR